MENKLLYGLRPYFRVNALMTPGFKFQQLPLSGWVFKAHYP